MDSNSRNCFFSLVAKVTTALPNIPQAMVLYRNKEALFP